MSWLAKSLGHYLGTIVAVGAVVSPPWFISYALLIGGEPPRFDDPSPNLFIGLAAVAGTFALLCGPPSVLLTVGAWLLVNRRGWTWQDLRAPYVTLMALVPCWLFITTAAAAAPPFVIGQLVFALTRNDPIALARWRSDPHV